MTRATVRVRPAGVDDVTALADLVLASDAGTGVFSGKPLDDPNPERVGARLHQIVDAAERTLLIAVDDLLEPPGIVGLLAARRDDIGAIDLTPVLHVTHLMVLPGQRRRGIGRALLSAAVQLADESGIDHVLATAASGSREANRYLARLGFAPLVVHRVASTATLRRTLGLADVAGRTAVLRRARLARAQRAGFAARAAHRGA